MRTTSPRRDESARADQAAIESARAAIAADKASVENARLNLEYCEIRSPIDGRTGSLQVKTARSSSPRPIPPWSRQPAFSGLRDVFCSRRSARGYSQIHGPGPLAVEAQIPNDTGEPALGQLSFIDNTVDSSTGAIKLKAAFPNKERELWPGQFVNVVMTVSKESECDRRSFRSHSDRPAGPIRLRREAQPHGGNAPGDGRPGRGARDRDLEGHCAWETSWSPTASFASVLASRSKLSSAGPGAANGKLRERPSERFGTLHPPAHHDTALIMSAILLFGIIAYRELPVSDSAQCGLSHPPGSGRAAGRQS